MKNPVEKSPSEIKHDERLLRRNQTLIDVVYGLVLFQLFLLLPKPSKEMIDHNDFSSLIDEKGSLLLTVLIGIIWVIIYWGQSNLQFGYLKHTTKTLGSLSIVQLFFLMLFLYFIKLDNDTGGDVLALFSQSLCLAIAGFIGVYFWHTAGRRNMLFDELTEREKLAIGDKFLPEPLAALITAPLAFAGVNWYTIGWLSVIPLAWYFRRRSRHKLEKQSHE